MSNLSEKELSLLNDSLTSEMLLVKKFQMLAEHSSDAEVQQKFNEISMQHQSHYNLLYSLLGQEENMKNIYSDKEVLSDGLDAEKSATTYYNTFSNECAHENVRCTCCRRNKGRSGKAKIQPSIYDVIFFIKIKIP